MSVRLGDVAKFVNGGAWNQSEYAEDGVPVVRVTDCKNGSVDLSGCKYLQLSSYERYKRHELDVGDLVIATVGSHPNQPGSVVGRPIIIPRSAEGALLNQNAVCLRPSDSRLNKRYLGFVGQSCEFRDYIIAHARGTANQVRMAIGLLKDMEIRMPPIDVQEKVASVLSSYDNLIENNLRRIKIMEEMAQNLFREWFVKFRFPGHEHSHMVDSPLGKIPEGWEVADIDGVATVHRGRSYRSKDLLDEGGLPFVNLKCVDRDGGFRRNGIKRYSGPFKESHKVITGDIVMAITDMTQDRRIVARVGRVPTLDADYGVISMDLVRIEPKEMISSDFLYGYFRGSDFADNLKQQANGANVLHLSPDRIRDYQFVLPTQSIRDRYTLFSAMVFQEIENLNRKNEMLHHTRELLLPKLISGELDVSKLDIDTRQNEV